jgi:hypothetical protein
MPSPTHAIWPTLSPQLANDILLAVQKGNKKLYRTAVEVMAPRMGVRRWKSSVSTSFPRG